jgi:hypothetical protein
VSNEARLFCYRPRKTQQSKNKKGCFSRRLDLQFILNLLTRCTWVRGKDKIYKSNIVRHKYIYHALHNVEGARLGRMHNNGGCMTIAQVQPLNIPTASELTKAHDFLFEADMLVTDVKSLFFNSGDFAAAARLKDIQGRLADEIRAVERLIAASKPVFRH